MENDEPGEKKVSLIKGESETIALREKRKGLLVVDIPEEEDY
jgi:hypothetical protein